MVCSKCRGDRRIINADGSVNGYYAYFPTIQAAAQGGYGASWGLIAEAGAGEQFVDQVIIGLYQLLDKL